MWAIGGDLGGTNVKLALVDGAGQVREAVRFPTPARGRLEPVLEELDRRVTPLRDRAEAAGVPLAGIGFGVAGLTDGEVVVVAPNMQGWDRVPFRAMLADRWGLPVVIENDANAAAWGEYWTGAGQGCHSVVVLTLGTGIGGGIVLEGKLWRGVTGMGAELGHLMVEPEGEACGCGCRGCLEAHASGLAIVRDARRGIAAGQAGAALAAFRARPETLTPRDVSEAATAGDPLAREVLARAGRYLGMALADLVNVLNPEVIVLAGGVAGAGELLLGPARQELYHRTYAILADHTRIALSKLGTEAGVVGAAGLAIARFGGEGAKV